MRLVAAWLAFWVGFGLLDRWAAKHGASLSVASRVLFHTDHPLGRLVFSASLGMGAGTLWHHIISGDSRG